MNTLYIMVGLPGSGKSTVAKELSEFLNIPIVSTDQIRMDITGSEENFDRDGYIWSQVVPAKLNMALLRGDVVFDATNLTEHYRNELKRSLSVPAEYVAVVVNTPVEECIQRQQLRERKVPSDRILEMNDTFVLPGPSENFSHIYMTDSTKGISMIFDEDKEIDL